MPAAAQASFGGAGVDIPLTNIRQTIARRLLQSKQTIPHWYCFNEVSMDRAMQFREELNADLPEGTRGLLGRLIRILGYGRKHSHDDLIASTRFHRILRRGREYMLETAGEGGDRVVQRGLRFICLNANISRQFEFIQASWLVNPKFEGLDEGDPIVANRLPLQTGRPSDMFTRPQANGLCRRSAALPQFTHVHGGGYFFMPGISALRYLAR